MNCISYSWHIQKLIADIDLAAIPVQEKKNVWIQATLHSGQKHAPATWQRTLHSESSVFQKAAD